MWVSERSPRFAFLPQGHNDFCLVALLCSCFEEEESERLRDRRETPWTAGKESDNWSWTWKPSNGKIPACFWKIRSVNGSSLVRDKLTGLWHFGRRTHSLHGTSNGKLFRRSPRAEASFLKEKKMEWRDFGMRMVF